MHVCERERHLCKKLRSITCIQVLITKTTKHPMIKNKLIQSGIKTSTLYPLSGGDQGGDLTSRRHYTGNARTGSNRMPALIYTWATQDTYFSQLSHAVSHFNGLFLLFVCFCVFCTSSPVLFISLCVSFNFLLVAMTRAEVSFGL